MLCRLQRSLERGSDEILAAGLGILELKSAVVVHSRCAAAERRAGIGLPIAPVQALLFVAAPMGPTTAAWNLLRDSCRLVIITLLSFAINVAWGNCRLALAVSDPMTQECQQLQERGSRGAGAAVAAVQRLEDQRCRFDNPEACRRRE